MQFDYHTEEDHPKSMKQEDIAFYWKQKKITIWKYLLPIAVITSFVLGYAIYTSIPKIKQHKVLVSHSQNIMNPALFPKWVNLTEYFRRKGNPHPEMSATAVLETNKPRLMTAIAVKGERNTHYKSKKGGYKKRHVGMYQINEKHWGKAGALPIDQALRAEWVLNELLKENNKNLNSALNNYGGSTKNKYAPQVLAELKHIPK